MSKFNYFDCVGGYDFEAFHKPAEEKREKGVFESAGDSSVRAMGMSAVLAWVEDGDYTFSALDEYIVGIADLDGDEKLTDDEFETYNEVLSAVADAMLSMGADPDNVTEFLDAEDDDAGEKLGGFLSEVFSGVESPDDEVIDVFANGEDGAVFECATPEPGGVFEAVYKKVKVVRGGKVVLKKKRIAGKVRLSAAQKAGLKKARRRAFSAASKIKRKKAMKIRKQRGI